MAIGGFLAAMVFDGDRLRTVAIGAMAFNMLAAGFFVDLYAPSLAYYAEGRQRPLTRNGIHPTEYGYWFLTRELLEQLGLSSQNQAAADPGARPQSYLNPGARRTPNLFGSRRQAKVI